MQRVCWVVALVTALAATGCSVNKALVPTGGSRSDGTVELSYEIAALQKAEVDMEKASKAAKERCRAWGYGNAHPFGGQRRDCQQYSNQYGCVRYLVTVTFQCSGASRPS